MGFLDEVLITVRSGNGGDGCVSFRREKFIPRGGPDGGDGGDGGNVIAIATEEMASLVDYRSQKVLKATHGASGKANNQTGKRGADLILKTPLGTVISDRDSGEILADLIHHGQRALLIHGGRGGKGNQHFATSTNRTPRYAQSGQPGKALRLLLSLKSLAAIGLVGLPNVGKSTLLSRLTKARPKIDRYPFTTLVPNLGVLVFDHQHSLVIADIPGLIEGASEGRGLGHRFLKHVERSRFLLHVIDITYQPTEDLLEDFYTLRSELAAFDQKLMDKPLIVIINKMDLYRTEHRNVDMLGSAFEKMGISSLPISAFTGKGLKKLKDVLFSTYFCRTKSSAHPLSSWN
jgi:GTP-binding protein